MGVVGGIAVGVGVGVPKCRLLTWQGEATALSLLPWADHARRRPSGRLASAQGPSLQQPPSLTAHAQSAPPV